MAASSKPTGEWLERVRQLEEKTKHLIKRGENIGDEEMINILLVGLSGAGKSTLVSSLRSCMTHEHGQEVSAAGKVDYSGSFTFRLRRYDAFEDETSRAIIYDMPGLLNQSDEWIVALLRCIIRGRVPPNEVVLFETRETLLTGAEVEARFPPDGEDPSRFIDRIVFVQTCTESIPENLTHTIFKLSNELDVPVFAVLTHIDKRNQQSSVFTKLFTKPPQTLTLQELDRAVGTEGSPRGFEMELYHRGTMVDGEYRDMPKTNHSLYLLWQGLLNKTYRKHSTGEKVENI